MTLPLTAGLRPLPRTIPPFRNETLSSYLRRLAMANRLDPDALRVHLTGQTRKTAAVPAERLAVLGGRPAATLRHAIPELTTPGDSADTGGSPPGRTLGLACQPCAVGRTAHDQVWCWRSDEDVICRRQRRWTGGGPGGTAFRQPDLSTQPDILHAHSRHRRLIRRHGRQAAADAFTAAAAICRTWHRQHQHDDDYHRLMIFHGRQPRQLAFNDPTIHAAAYPQTVALAELLASPPWRSLARQHSPGRDRFLDRLRATVAPDYPWPCYHHDPLVEWLFPRHDDPRTRDFEPSPLRETARVQSSSAAAKAPSAKPRPYYQPT